MFSLTRRAILASTKRAFATTSATLVRGEQSIIPLSNVEAQWATLSTEEQAIVHQQLAELQKRDWRSLSRDEKKAGQSIFLMLSELSELAFGEQMP
jgi:cytochrome c oxidase subunit 4